MKKLTPEELRHEWRELQARGVPLEPPEFRTGINFRDRTGSLIINQERDVGSQSIFALPAGRTAYILKAFIQSRPGKTRITNYWLEVPWPDAFIQWLPDPAEVGSRGTPYTFTDEGWQYPRKDVLNHRMKDRLTGGDIRNGLLLGDGLTRPPKEYPHGTWVHAILHVEDQWKFVHSTEFELRLHRPPKVNDGRRTSANRTEGLDSSLASSTTESRG